MGLWDYISYHTVPQYYSPTVNLAAVNRLCMTRWGAGLYSYFSFLADGRGTCQAQGASCNWVLQGCVL